ncbi:IclR family transcriptional regulator [Mesorhizobium sp. RMAD-H1]|uniref:IclR family transcriptional regulator n=1 Tax=Mesorhizobium sp. RMAD-H1 TaxID=2587065 RepID=UPI001616C987|nr:IclR family transcriptional regulator [Mesorhizobium sp. RMAD-H1]MBB2971566.1 DNA-binding IclR family transcriptional regulator [Mesorhizobium sp. RMAD-H1]
MSTVGKALTLLNLFSAEKPELGLVELARGAGYDKATTRRLLVSLAEHGFVEQDPESRLYRIGASLTRFARIREARLPLLQTALPFIRKLAEETGETVHLSEAGNGTLATIYVEHPARANRVNVDVGGLLPLHSTASGIAYLSHARDAVVKAALASPLTAFTAYTATDRAAVVAAMDAARRRGYSTSEQGYEEGVYSVAAAILGADGFAIGTLAIAAPLVRTPKAKAIERGKAVMIAAREITQLLNGDRINTVAKASA